jgi:protein-L-isoaspartate(D-aspartate) O-methyltransferase
VPEPLVDQLREGGMMIIPMGERYQQSFYLLQKVDGVLEQKKLVPTLFVPMTGESEDRREVQPEANNPQLVNGDFEADTNQDGRADGWHYQRQTEMHDVEPMSVRVCLRFSNTEPGQLSHALQGCGVNGRKVGALDFAVWVRRDQVAPGPATDDVPALVVHFYDSVRRDLGTALVFHWRGSENWQQSRKRIAVPPMAREMIVRIGLNGGTGTLDLDDLRMQGVLR